MSVCVLSACWLVLDMASRRGVKHTKDHPGDPAAAAAAAAADDSCNYVAARWLWLAGKALVACSSAAQVRRWLEVGASVFYHAPTGTKGDDTLHAVHEDLPLQALLTADSAVHSSAD